MSLLWLQEGLDQHDGYEASKQIIIDAENALASWTLDSAAVKPTLSLHQSEYEEPAEDDLANAEEEFAKLTRLK